MKFSELSFHDYYHKILLLEVDDLTEECASQIHVSQEDCFAMVSSYIGETGMCCFNVLAIGKDWQHCTKGLKQKKMLGVFTMDQVVEKEVRIVEADLATIQKNDLWLSAAERHVDEDRMRARQDERLDSIRDLFYPDCVLTGILSEDMIREYAMSVIGFNGPFLEGKLVEEPTNSRSIHKGDLIRALPYQIDTQYRLLAIFTGDHLSRSDQKAMDALIQEGNASGFGFSQGMMKN